jgi:hypothetical protein
MSSLKPRKQVLESNNLERRYLKMTVNKQFILLLVSLFVISSLFGCGITAEIACVSGVKTEVEDIKISTSSQKILILDGDASRQLRVKDIDIITILPVQTCTIDGKLYYQARIQLKNGVKIGYDSQGKKETMAFICLNETVFGKSNGGEYSVSLDKISEINFK